MLSPGLEIAFGALAAYVIADMLAKNASAKLGAQRSALAKAGFQLFPMLLLAYFFGVTTLNATVALFSVLAGIATALTWFLVYKTLETEQVSNTVSLTGLSAIMIIVFGILILKENVTAVEGLSIVAILVGAFLATTNSRFRLNRGYVPAIAAQAFSGASAFLLVFALQASGGIFTPLIIAGIAEFATMAAYLKIRPQNTKHLKTANASVRQRAYGAFLGIFQGLGGVGFLALAYVNFLAVGYAITATEGGFVILLGYLIYRDRFEKHQAIGLILLVIGAIAISVA